MPTPSPSIVPSVAAIDGTETRWPSRPIRLKPAESPKIAVRIGIGIAAAVPKAKSSTMIATAIPTSSLDSVPGEETAEPR